jgi:phosphoribosyl-dephospho-CoA transferase
MGDAPSTTDLPRHSLIDVDPRAWTTALAVYHWGLAHDPVIRDWAGLGRPLIARRRAACDRPDRVPAGLPLPPDIGKQRLALALPSNAILSVRPPPLLASIHEVAPTPWRTTIADLLAIAASHSVMPRVFGSFAWQALTGLGYVSATSDLDLIWPLGDDLSTLLDAIAAVEKTAPGRLDGEIVGPLGAVHWRELFAGDRDVLMKTSTAVTMISRESFVGTHR